MERYQRIMLGTTILMAIFIAFGAIVTFYKAMPKRPKKPEIKILYTKEPIAEKWTVEPQISNIGEEEAEDVVVSYEFDKKISNHEWKSPTTLENTEGKYEKEGKLFISPLIPLLLPKGSIEVSFTFQGYPEWMNIEVSGRGLEEKVKERIELTPQLLNPQDP